MNVKVRPQKAKTEKELKKEKFKLKDKKKITTEELYDTILDLMGE